MTKEKKSQGLFLGLILILAMVFRFTGINWDNHNHLHPDERFLTMVGNALKLTSLKEYLAPQISTLNPENMGYGFFVYGTFPLTLNKIIAVIFNADNYTDFTIQGRRLSAFFDVLTVLMVYLIARLITRQYKLASDIPLWSAYVYTVMVLPIQLSHFFAVDTFLTTFMTASIFFSLKYAFNHKWFWAIMAGVSLGLSLANKVNAVFAVPLLLALITLVPKKKEWLRLIMAGLLLMISAYLTLRIADPTKFEQANWLNPTISSAFIESVKSLKVWEGPDVWFPPAVQWITKPPIWFAAKNMTVLGVGVIPMMLVFIGIGLSIREAKYNRGKWIWLLFLGWSGAVFLYQSTQFVKALRYFIYLYPLLALWAGLGASYLSAKAKWATPVLIMSLLIWPLMFLSIYLQPHPRVQASAWILENIPEKSVLLSELWDDGLPVNVPGLEPKPYKGEQLPVFDQDTPDKWTKMNLLLESGDYYLLTSNRGWGSVTTVPWKYPVMSRFYEDILSGRLPYQKVAEFTSYPSLGWLGIPLTLPDDWADETFTVYDHPKVMIYKLK